MPGTACISYVGFDVAPKQALRPASERTDQWNPFAAIAPVGQKISIGGENERVAFYFGHSYEAGVGKRHRHIFVALHIAQDFIRMFEKRKVRVGAHKVVSEQSSQCDGPVANGGEKKERFGEDGFAGHHWMMQMCYLLLRPDMMGVSAIEQPRNRSRINENATRHIFSSVL